MDFKGTDYRVWYDARTATIFFEGSLRLNTAEYKPITVELQKITAQKPSAVTLHLRELDFLNSSGINMLYKFVIGLRKAGGIGLTVRGNSAIGWQTKSLRNIKRFLPRSEIIM